MTIINLLLIKIITFKLSFWLTNEWEEDILERKKKQILIEWKWDKHIKVAIDTSHIYKN